jgi:hypothetical protein
MKAFQLFQPFSFLPGLFYLLQMASVGRYILLFQVNIPLTPDLFKRNFAAEQVTFL